MSTSRDPNATGTVRPEEAGLEPYVPPRVQSLKLSEEAAEALT